MVGEITNDVLSLSPPSMILHRENGCVLAELIRLSVKVFL